MNDETWKYVENQFDNQTKNSKKRMKEIGIHHRDALGGSALPITPALTARCNTALNPYLAAYNNWLGLRAQFKGATLALEQAVEHLSSTDIEDIEVAYKGAYKRTSPQYTTAFPQGREPFQTGGIDDRITALETLTGRLTTQLGALAQEVQDAQNNNDPNLPQLQTRLQNLNDANTRAVTVLGTLGGLRTTQGGLETQVDLARLAVDPLRIVLAAALYGNLGQLMTHFATTPANITAFFDLTKLRESGEDEEDPAPVPPAPPAPPNP